MNQQLFDYISASPTAYHATAHTAKLLRDAGYTALQESADWNLEPNHAYYVTRNGSSLIAFRTPAAQPVSFMMTAAHCDSPCFKIKENAELAGSNYVQFSVEKYGGMICSTWMDRPLSIAGRVLVKTKRGIESRLVDFHRPMAVIPNVAIHMNRQINDGVSYNPAVDMLPLYGTAAHKAEFRKLVAEAAGVAEADLLTTDLFVYNPQEGVCWNDLISAPRLDDLQCAFAALTAFLQAKHTAAMPIYCLFDNEEVGSQTKQGAASTFLRDVLCRVTEALGMRPGDYRRTLANSFLVSCDNAHAIHPNHPEYSDKNHAVMLNHGIVIKYNANQKYTSDAVSAAIFQTICEEAGTPVQVYTNRADMPGGSTLGNIANTQTSLNTVDIGLPQLAMHSAWETAGAEDTSHLVTALTAFYSRELRMEQDGVFCLN